MTSLHHYRVTNDQQFAVKRDTTDEVPGNFTTDLRSKLKINILKLNEEEIVFDLVGIDASIANALRRIMLAEVGAPLLENTTALCLKLTHLLTHVPNVYYHRCCGCCCCRFCC